MLLKLINVDDESLLQPSLAQNENSLSLTLSVRSTQHKHLVDTPCYVSQATLGSVPHQVKFDVRSEAKKTVTSLYNELGRFGDHGASKLTMSRLQNFVFILNPVPAFSIKDMSSGVACREFLSFFFSKKHTPD